MSHTHPHTKSYPMRFRNGYAVGLSIRWREGSYCTILTEAGLVGCGMYDVEIGAEFRKALAVVRATPEQPLKMPEDLLDARVSEVTPQARALGVEPGMTGREAVELLLAATANRASTSRGETPGCKFSPDAEQ